MNQKTYAIKQKTVNIKQKSGNRKQKSTSAFFNQGHLSLDIGVCAGDSVEVAIAGAQSCQSGSLNS